MMMLLARDRSMLPMLSAVSHALRPELVSPHALGRVGEAMSLLPDALTDLYYLEARLNDDPSVDLVVHVARKGRDVLLGRATGDAFLGRRADSQAWRRVRALANAWSDEQSRLSRALDHIWLELDVGSGAESATLSPGVFACFGELPRRDFTPRRWHAHALVALEPLFDNDRSPAFDWRLGQCFERLPTGAYVPYVGVMLGRYTESVRVCVLGLNAASLVQYLDDLGWAAGYHQIEMLIAELTHAQPAGPLRGGLMVHVDVTKHGVWRLGVEFACERRMQHRGVFQETALLDALVMRALASRAKCDALIAWPGGSAVRVSSAEERAVLRRVNHIKVVFRADRPPEAKAYLAVCYFPRLPRVETTPRRASVAPSRGILKCS